MHNMSNPEVDKPQQQKAVSGSSPVSHEQGTEADMAQTNPD